MRPLLCIAILAAVCPAARAEDAKAARALARPSVKRALQKEAAQPAPVAS